MKTFITRCCKCNCHHRPPNDETPEEEGRRLFAEGLGLSELWGDVSEVNFHEYECVLNAFCDAKNDKALVQQRTHRLTN